MKTEKTNKSEVTRKQVKNALNEIAQRAQSLNNCLRAVNAAICGENASDAAVNAALRDGSLVKEILKLQGLELTRNTKITVKMCQDALLSVNKIGDHFAIYKNVPVYDMDGRRVYVANKDGELRPLSVYQLAEIGRYNYTPAVFFKAVEQNWFNRAEAKKAEASAEKARKFETYWVKSGDEFTQVKSGDVRF